MSDSQPLTTNIIRVGCQFLIGWIRLNLDMYPLYNSDIPNSHVRAIVLK